MRKIKINLKFIFMCIMILPFLKTNYITWLPNINLFYNIMQICVTAYVSLRIIKNKKFPIYLIPLLMIEVLTILTTLINSVYAMGAIKNAIQVLTFCLLIHFFINDDQKTFMKSILFVLIILNIVNIITLIQNPTGIMIGYVRYWFFGTKNNFMVFVIPTLVLAYYYYYYIKNNKLFFYTLLCFLNFSILFTESATSILGIIFFDLFFIIKDIFFTKRKINIKILSVIYLIIIILVVVFKVQNIFGNLIGNIFGKNATFTGRTYIWDMSLKYIYERPFFGIGFEPTEIRIFKYGGKTSFINSHNMLVELFYKGGIVSTLIFFHFFGEILNKIRKCLNTKFANFFSWVILTYFILLFTEYYAPEILAWFMVIVYNLLSENSQEKKIEEWGN